MMAFWIMTTALASLGLLAWLADRTRATPPAVPGYGGPQSRLEWLLTIGTCVGLLGLLLLRFRAFAPPLDVWAPFGMITGGLVCLILRRRIFGRWL